MVHTLGVGSTLWKSFLTTKSCAGNRILFVFLQFRLGSIFFGLNLGFGLARTVTNIDVCSIRNGIDHDIVVADGDYFGFGYTCCCSCPCTQPLLLRAVTCPAEDIASYATEGF